MALRKRDFVLALVLVVSLLLAGVLPAAAAERGVRSESGDDRSLDKINSPALRTMIQTGTGVTADVIVFAAPDVDLSPYMAVGPERIPRGGVRIVTGQATPKALIKIASLSGVFAIQSPEDLAVMQPVPPDRDLPDVEVDTARALPRLSLTKPAPAEEFAPPQGGPTPESYIGVDLMGAHAAWAKGYTGEGVVVGHVDSGADFGHPDLEGTWAVATEPRYAGWPAVYDPLSAEIYVATGEAFGTQTWLNDTPGGYSYYVDTSTVVEGTPGEPVSFDLEVPSLAYGSVVNNYTFNGSPSTSGEYHVGVHPDLLTPILFGPAGDYPAVILVDENVPYRYDVVYVDMDYSYTFDSYERFTLGYPTGWYWDPISGTWSRDWTGDGVADVSAGIMYWIADGENAIPGTDVIYVDPPVPGNGDLVLFYGDYNGNSHGTGTASAVAAQGVITSTVGTAGDAVLPWADVSNGVVFGTAPGAKIFSSPLAGNTYDAWVVQALGYDGVYGTADDSQLDTNSWGYFLLNDGWDVPARFLTWMNAVVAPDTLWLSGTANGGYGYGTAASPGSASSAIAVGGYSLHGTDTGHEFIAGPDQILWGDLTPFSSRGPTTTGQQGPSVTAIADGATGDVPLMLAIYYNGVIDGQQAWWGFGGTSQATPFTAGVGALVYDAYEQTHGGWPDHVQARQFLMSSADDMHNDPFAQGAGRVNADRATDIAAGLDGIYVSPSEWTAGGFRGSDYPAFAHILKPGESASQQFTVHNAGDAVAEVDISDDVLLKEKELTYRVTVLAKNESSFSVRRPDYMVEIPLAEIPADTALMRVFLTTPYDQFSLGDPTVPSAMEIDGLFYARVYNWTDLNENGILWDDTNGNGAVNNHELDNPSPLDDNTSQEFNSFGLSYQYDPAHEVRVERPQQRVDDGLFVGVHHYESASRAISRDVPETHLTIKVEFYTHTDWALLTETPAAVSVPAGGSSTFEATIQVPLDQDPGLYEGAIWADDGVHKTVVPVVLNVAPNLVAADMGFDFGWVGDPNTLYDNGRMFGGQDWLGNGWLDQGDWRMFFVDVPDDLGEHAGAKWLIDTSWENVPHDIDTLVYGPSPNTPPFTDETVFGPYGLELLNGSPDTSFPYDAFFPYGRYAYSFETATGGPREMVTADIMPGLNGIWLHNVLYGGHEGGEPFEGRVGTVSLLPNPNVITTTLTAGTEELTFESSIFLDGLLVEAFGLSQPLVFENEPIGVAPIEDDYEWVHAFTVSSSSSVEVILSSPDVPDLDLFVDYWNGSSWVSAGSSTGSSSDEYVRLSFPTDGDYRIGVDNYSSLPGHLDLILNVIGGSDLWVTGVPDGPIFPGEVYHMTLHWDKAMAEGNHYGAIYAGPPQVPHAIALEKRIFFGEEEEAVYHLYLPLVFRDQ